MNYQGLFSGNHSIKETLQRAKQNSLISPHSIPMFGETNLYTPLSNPMVSNEILEQSCDDQGLVELEPPNLAESNKSNKSNNYGYQTFGMPGEVSDEKNLSLINQYDYVSLFCKDKYINCTTKSKSCSLCNGSGFIVVEKVREDLNNRFKAYYKKNYYKLLEYFQDKYNITIDSFEQLMEITQQIVLLNKNQKFIFRCNRCNKFYNNEHNVYLQNEKRYCQQCAWVIGHDNVQKLEYDGLNEIIPAQTPVFTMPQLNDHIDQQFI